MTSQPYLITNYLDEYCFKAGTFLSEKLPFLELLKIVFWLKMGQPNKSCFVKAEKDLSLSLHTHYYGILSCKRMENKSTAVFIRVSILGGLIGEDRKHLIEAVELLSKENFH